ncbi:hypothetical protein BDV18DRAFT_147432 [Aspergillus unguis]
MAADRCLSADPMQAATIITPRSNLSETHLRRSASEDLQSLTLKRQKRTSSGEPSKAHSKSQTFYFVDSNSSSREKRAHVMRYHVQEKRRQQRHPRSGGGSMALQYSPWEEAESTDDGQRLDTIPPPGRRDHPPILYTKDIKRASVKPKAVQSPASPITILDASRKDPLDSQPFTSTADMELADYWTNRLTYWSGQNKHIKDCAFKTALAHPLSFQATILSYCARWKAQMYNHDNAQEIHYHVETAKKAVDDALNGRLNIDSDSLAMALAGLALQENRFGSEEEAEAYEEHAVQVLRTRPRSSGLAEVFFHYVRYVMMPPPLQGLASWENSQEWLVTFLRAAEGLMLFHNNEEYLTSAPQRRTAFQMDSPLFSLLSSGPRPSCIPQDSRIYVVRDVPTQDFTRTAALIHITATLYDFQDSPNKSARFLIYLNDLVRKHELDRYPACESFIWHLLEENCDIDLKDPERAWSTGELLKIHKRLRPDLQFQYNETLFSFLMLAQPTRSVDNLEKELLATSRVELDI